MIHGLDTSGGPVSRLLVSHVRHLQSRLRQVERERDAAVEMLRRHGIEAPTREADVGGRGRFNVPVRNVERPDNFPTSGTFGL